MTGRAALFLTFLLATSMQASPVRAEVNVSGSAAAVRIEAKDAALDEVLSALNKSVGVKYRSAAPLQKRLTGTYEGTVRQVLPRLLEGYDFIVKGGDGAVEVVVIGGAKAGDSQAAPVRRRRAD